MKTAMQELLDIIYKAISNAKELKSNGLNHKGDIDIMLNVLNVYRVIIERDMLEKEKEQMVDFAFFTYQGVSQLSEVPKNLIAESKSIFESNFERVYS